MDEHQAAAKLQGMWRARKARGQMKVMAKCAIEKVFDDSTGCYFYFNNKTNQSSWVKPNLLKEDEDFLTPRSRQRLIKQEEKRKQGLLKTAANMTEDEAARFIQNLFRARKARLQIKELIASVYEKSYDDEGNVFYYNHKTGESSWEKPKLLGSGDLDDDLVYEEEQHAEEGQVYAEEEDPYFVEKEEKFYEDPATVAARAERLREEALEDVRVFLESYEILEVYDRLVSEGFDDMDAICAMQESDIDDIGVNNKYAKLLYEAVCDYREQNNIINPFEDESADEDEDFETESVVESGDDEDGMGDGRDKDEEKEQEVEEEAPETKSQGDDEDDESEYYSEEDSVLGNNDDIPGVKMTTVFPGDMRHYPKKGQFALVHYIASLEDGTVFEASRKRGRPFDFLVGAGHVIQGWDKAIRRMSRGERANLVISPEMAYGKNGRLPLVPPNATLHFELELIDSYYAPVGQLLGDEDDEDEDE